ncbi:MAG: tetratricopeptide repeat protein [Thermoanaerobaculia bacterium]|nr:tetratricopeptide repeat protein [Thermoanaerobaculia bacterium]
MSPERWKRAGEVFHTILDEDPADPTDLLEHLCAGDEELAANVLDLLHAHRDAPTFIDRPAFQILPAPPEPLPERIGSYRIVRSLGRGGMGTVYLAERDDGTFEKQVALKVLSDELALPDFQERFHRERQILARLEHPSITRLLDGGTTADGRPFLVVELVDGQPLDRFITEVEPGLDARLELFVEMCSAVHAAHQQLVVHRDLKPGNILVTAEGHPKLLDFGIAKLLSAELAGGQTGPSERLLTPPYASPEQIRGEAIGTTADVFGLGVLLYELLAECHPFEEERRDPARLALAIVERDPPPPSVTAATLPDDLAPRRWSARLRGDLDQIVQKALHKDPARRYSSAEALARDIERHRRGFPVEARGDSLTYVTVSFLRRHRLAASATATAFLVLVAATLGLWLQRSEILRERDNAETVSDYLVEVFAAADPGTSRGRDITAGELLDRARQRAARTDLAPATRAAFLQPIGEAYAGLGDYRAAADLLSESLEIRRASGTAEAEDLADTASALGGVLLALGELERAHTLLEEAVTLLESSLGFTHPETALALSELAASHQQAGRLEEADTAFRDALKRLEEGNEPVARAHVRHRLAALLRERDQTDSAIELLRLGLEDLVSVRGGRPDPDVAVFLRDLGTILRRQGDHDDALRRYREALAMQHELFPDGHPDIAVTLSQIASVTQSQGRYDEAEALFAEVVEMRRSLLGDGHRLVGNTLLNQANLAVDRGDLSRAADLYRSAIAIQEVALPDDHLDLASSRTGLATVLSRLGEPAQAEELHRQLLDTAIRSYGERHSRVAILRNNLARSLQAQGRLEEAHEEFGIVVEVIAETLGSDHPLLATAWNNLADVRRLSGDLEASAEAFDRALEIAHSRLGADNPTTLQIAVNRMGVLLRRAPDDDTRRRATALAKVVDRVLGPEHRSSRQLQRFLEISPPAPSSGR